MHFPKILKFLFFFLLLIKTSQLSAQDYYLHFNAGYGLGLPGEVFYKSFRDTSTYNLSKEKLQFGGGLHSSVSFGFMTRSNWGLDFQFFYQNQFGDSYSNEWSNWVVEGNNRVKYATIVYHNKYTSWSVGFTPSLKIVSDNRNFIPFLSIGPSVYYNFIRHNRSDEMDGVQDYQRIEEYEGSVSFGGIASVGTEFEINRDLFFTVSIRGSYGYMKPTKSKLIKDGNRDLNTSPVRSKESEYVDEVHNNEPSLDNEPRKELSFAWDYSSVSLMLGVRWVLN